MDAPQSPIVARFLAQSSGLPKHLRVRAAIVEAVEAGELPLGSKMTGERELSQMLGISLGTTQKALGRLMDEGFLARRQGRGTFIGGDRKAVSGSWHFRFMADDGKSELPLFVTILERRLVGDAGPWADSLGPDRKGYVLLRRRVDIGGLFACSSNLYLPATRFGRILRIAQRRLTDTNLKSLLESEYAAPTLASEGTAHVIVIGAEDAAVMGVARNLPGLQLNVIGRTIGRVAITFQRIVIPPTPHGLKLDFNPPEPHRSAAG